MSSRETEFCLRWNNYRPSVMEAFENCYGDAEFTDVTISAGSIYVKAHRVFLSACSAYFRAIFREIPLNAHPVILLKDVEAFELRMLVDFMYHGEVLVKQQHIKGLLTLAKSLGIRGLSQQEELNEAFRDGTLGTDTATEQEEPRERTPRREVPSYPYNLSQGNRYAQQCPPMSPLENPGKRPGSKVVHPKKSKMPRNESPPQQLGRPSSRGTPVRSPPRRQSPLPPRDFHQGLVPPMSSQMNVTPSSSASSSHSEDDGKVVNLSVNNNGHDHYSPEDSPPPVIAKMEVEDDNEPSSSNGPTEDREEDNEQKHNEDNGKPLELSGLPHLALGAYRYPIPPQEGFAGPSGIMPPSGPSEPDWRHSNLAQAMASEPEPQPGSHPVFNELYGGGGVVGGEIGGGANSGGASVGGKKAVPTPCPICHKVLSNAYNMRVHLETHQHDISYKCIICGIRTRTRDTMRKHCSHVHKLRSTELKNSFKKISKDVTPKFKSPSRSPASQPGFSGLETLTSLFIPKTEPGVVALPPASAPLNFSRGSLDSIVNKLIQKQ